MFRPLTQGWRGLLPSVALLSTRSISGGTSTDVKFAGKVAVITGSTNGIGLAIARRLAQDGAHVVISSRKQQNVDRAVAALQGEGLSVTGTVCHVGKAEDRERLVARALEHCGGVDFLVCTAGVNPLVGSTLGSSEQVWDKDATHHVHARQEGQHLPTPLVRGHRAHLLTQRPSGYLEKILNINVKAPALLLSQLLPHMEKRGQGSVVLVSSISAYVSLARLGAYNVSKTALLGLTKTLAVELAPKNIRVNCLVPGIIKTPFSQVLSTYPTFVDYLTELYGVHRKGQPEDCAGLVSFLCSPDASYISGENIVVAGFSPHL